MDLRQKTERTQPAKELTGEDIENSWRRSKSELSENQFFRKATAKIFSTRLQERANRKNNFPVIRFVESTNRAKGMIKWNMKSK